MKKEFVTKEEFCEAMHTHLDCWIFKDEKEYPITYWKEIKDDETIYHMEHGGIHRRFIDIPQYGEIWMSVETPTYRSMYSTWTVY